MHSYHRFSILLAFVVGCSDDSGSTAASQFLADYCQLMMTCCTNAGIPANPARCQQVMGALIGNATYDPGKGDACRIALQQASQNGTVCPLDVATVDTSSCDGAFVEPGDGTRQPGQSCEYESECIASNGGSPECLPASTPGGGDFTHSCSVVFDGKQGDTPCVGTKSDSMISYDVADTKAPEQGYMCNKAKGLVCDSPTKACKALKNVDEPCTGYSDCVDAAFCDYVAKKCAARLPAGSSCKSSSTACDAASYCDATQTCVALLDNGAACNSGQECKGKSCTNKVCKGSANLALAFICQQ